MGLFGIWRSYRAIPLIKDTPPIDELAICVPILHRATDVSIRKYAEICGKLQKLYGDLQQNTETRQIPVGQISYSSMGGVALFNGIAHSY